MTGDAELERSAVMLLLVEEPHTAVFAVLEASSRESSERLSDGASVTSVTPGCPGPGCCGLVLVTRTQCEFSSHPASDKSQHATSSQHI